MGCVIRYRHFYSKNAYKWSLCSSDKLSALKNEMGDIQEYWFSDYKYFGYFSPENISGCVDEAKNLCSKLRARYNKVIYYIPRNVFGADCLVLGNLVLLYYGRGEVYWGILGGKFGDFWESDARFNDFLVKYFGVSNTQVFLHSETGAFADSIIGLIGKFSGIANRYEGNNLYAIGGGVYDKWAVGINMANKCCIIGSHIIYDLIEEKDNR